MSKALKVFISYSHQDRKEKNELCKRLAVMEEQNKLVTWYDGQLTPGDKTLQENVLKNVKDSDMLFYLVSAASLASKNCNEELAAALNAEIRVIPIILGRCDWLNHQLSNFMVLPDRGMPIKEWVPESKGWQNVMSGIRGVVDKMLSQADPLSSTSKKEIDTELAFQHGTVMLMLGQIDTAVTVYSHVIKLNSCHVDAYNNRGTAYYQKGEFDNAVQDFNTAIKLNPRCADSYNNRGKAYVDKGEFDFAIEDYNTAIKLNPQLALAYYNRGEAWLHLKEWDNAKADFTTAKRLGVDIIAMFHNSYKDVETYQKNRLVKLPEDLALLLTQRRRDRYPKLQNVLDADGNSLESPDVVNLREQLRNAGPSLSDYINTKSAFGINTTPTDVFVVNKATRKKLIAAHPSFADILKPFLHGQDIRRWHVDTPQHWLIFTHRGIAIDDYPAILKYLEKHQDSLQKRKGKQAWYELPVSLDNAERFAQPKLVCPNTYNYQTFAVDTEGFYYGNTSYLIPTKEKWLCGLLNSRTVEWFYSQVSNQLTIAPLRARSGYIQQIPIPDITPVHKALIAKIVDYLIYLQQQPEINSKDLEYARDRIMLGYFERVIDGLVYEAYLPAELHKSDKVFLQPLLDEGFPLIEEIQGDKMSVFRDIFELLYERTHPIRRNLFFIDSVKQVRVIQGKL